MTRLGSLGLLGSIGGATFAALVSVAAAQPAGGDPGDPPDDVEPAEPADRPAGEPIDEAAAPAPAPAPTPRAPAAALQAVTEPDADAAGGAAAGDDAGDPAAAAEMKMVPPREDDTGFRFGSYGRIVAGTDLRGSSPDPVQVVAHGPRVIERSYLELEFAYGFRAPTGVDVRTVTTLAFNDTLFHYTGEFDARPALRNFYAVASWDSGASVWAGSRMYRGDDIYLFDYWPLDDQNTVGAGLRVKRGPVEVAVHGGVNRLLADFQYQEREVAAPELGATTAVQLDRQRSVASATATWFVDPGPADLHAKVKVHAEVQGLPSGTRLRDDSTPEALPRDWGTTVGAQLGVWGMAPPERGYRRHANLFARWSKGLAAFDELAPPSGFDTTLHTYPRASELVFGLGVNWDDRWGHVLLGAVARRFVDADPNVRDVDDGWEYAVDARPLVHLGRGVFAGADLAYSARFPRGLMPSTQVAADPAVVSIAPMIALSPMGPSAYDRPQIRLVYRAAHLSEGALALYPDQDQRRNRPWIHFLGVTAEWWFNSNSYR